MIQPNLPHITNRRHSGLTAVEVLVSIIIAVLLLGSAYQIYSSLQRSAAEAEAQAKADRIAYDLLRQNQNSAENPCVAKAPAISLPSYAKLPNANAILVISCPYGTSSSTSLVSVTVNYTDPNPKEVTRAILVNK